MMQVYMLANHAFHYLFSFNVIKYSIIRLIHRTQRSAPGPAPTDKSPTNATSLDNHEGLLPKLQALKEQVWFFAPRLFCLRFSIRFSNVELSKPD